MKTLKNQKTKDLELFDLELLSSAKVVYNIQEWIRALRSGEYNQGIGFLHIQATNSFCCLGVATSICRLDELSSHNLQSTYKHMGLRVKTGKTNIPDTKKQMGCLHLTNLNDDYHWTFVEIAQLLEDQLKVCLKEIGGNEK